MSLSCLNIVVIILLSSLEVFPGHLHLGAII
jgi:hypothetical protein